MVLRLKFCTREDHVLFTNEVQTLLSKEECGQDLVEGLKSDDFVVRRLCFQWMALTNNVPEDVLKDSLNNSDVLVRLLAAKIIRNTPLLTNKEALLQLMRVNLYMPVRQQWL